MDPADASPPPPSPVDPGRNWSRTFRYTARELVRPRSVSELQALVAGESRVKALGSRHSFSSVADTPGVLVSLAGIPQQLEVDSAAHTALVGGGVLFGDLAEQLVAQDLALGAMASLPHISVAGGVATGTHGSGTTTQSLAGAIRSLEMVTADGDLVTVSPASHPDTFEGMVVALGALGVITRLELATLPGFAVRQAVYRDLPLEHLDQESLETVLDCAYSVSLFTRWHGPAAHQVWVKQKVGAGTAQTGHAAQAGQAAQTDQAGQTAPGGSAGPTGEDSRTGPAGPRIPTDADSPFPADLLGAVRAEAPMHPVPGMPAEACTDQTTAPGPFHERLAHFRSDHTPSSGDEIQSEYLIDRRHLAEAMTALRAIGAHLQNALQVSEIRTVASDPLWLSMAEGRESVALHFTWTDDHAAVDAAVPLVEEAIAPFEPRPHWGKVTAFSPEVVRSRYRRADDFAALVDTWDPRGVFRNAMLEGLGFAPNPSA
ncbi:MAG: FAD-binding protein [Brachybacterium sp.]|nr:FAD-binding protein [Brachybacterium sp.]